jgi:hypothetical protein
MEGISIQKCVIYIERFDLGISYDVVRFRIIGTESYKVPGPLTYPPFGLDRDPKFSNNGLICSAVIPEAQKNPCVT